MIEKYYFYVKELFFSYSKILNMENKIDEHIGIVDKINIYLNEFINKNFGYLDNLIKTMENIPKQIFYSIIYHTIIKLNEAGQECIKNNVKNFVNKALLYFDKVNFFSKNYLNNISKLKEYFSPKDFGDFLIEIEINKKYLELLKSNQIIFLKDSIKQKKLYEDPEFGFTKPLSAYIVFKRLYENILENYEKNLLEFNGKMNLEEAICLANIIKINYIYLRNKDYENYFRLSERCETISKVLGINENDDEWYKEFKDLYDILKINMLYIKEKEIFEKYQYQFDELDEQVNKSNRYIQYILENFPYKHYEEDKMNKVINFTIYSEELIKYLKEKYNPGNYKFKLDDELAQLYYFLFEHIYNKLEEKLHKEK